MVSPYSFIITPKGKKQYNTEKKLENNSSLILASSIENASDVNRIGIVEAVPVNYNGDISIGDEVVVHHNVFRDYYGYNGKIKHSSSYLFDNLFLVDESEIYVFRTNPNEKWKTNLDYCLVIPVWSEKFNVTGKTELTGRITHTSVEDMLHQVVGFTPESEYEVYLNDDNGEENLYYRMRNKDICIKY